LGHTSEDTSFLLKNNLIIPDLLQISKIALEEAVTLLELAKVSFVEKLEQKENTEEEFFEINQVASHGLAWLATYIEGLRQTQCWGERLNAEKKFGLIEKLILQIAFSEYLSQIKGGIPMSQTEIIRLPDIGVDIEISKLFSSPELAYFFSSTKNQSCKNLLVKFLTEQFPTYPIGNLGLDEEMGMVRDQFKRFTVEKVDPHAHNWHLKDELIPLTLIQEMAELGVFGLTIPQAYGGLGLNKTAMCVVSEELSRGYIGVGSLGTRSEIAAELIISGGTNQQKKKWLPRLATGEVLPTAVFTEPNTGSNLGALTTRAVKSKKVYKIKGNKTWITHASRAHLMTLLARTDPSSIDHKGLSMFLAEKLPANTAEDFPSRGIAGTEIPVLGYRGMKEYELAFDAFEVSEENLLGEVEGLGFKQLMQTFESARIQTAARAIGVAQSALELGLKYALDREQFGKKIIKFPRVSNKLAMMAVELMVARQLTYFSARQKDIGKRCDLEAGMSKLLSARLAWSAADNSLQIHGGNGFSLEYPISRVLCDARILNIFEGAAEIQAHVISRRLISDFITQKR
jgi:(2S)-methylsuccinyl-CoA dehydrogenase